MKLSRVHIRNFRSIRNATLKLDPSCRVLVGINEAGKSNILRALALLDQTRKVVPDDVREIAPAEETSQECFVRFVFSLDNDERAAAYERLRNSVVGDTEVIISTGGQNITLKEFVLSRTELLYQVNIADGERSFTGWALSDAYEISGEWSTPKPKASAALDVDGKRMLLSAVTAIQSHLVSEDIAGEVVPLTTSVLNLSIIDALWDESKRQLPSCVFWAYSDKNLLPASISIADFTATPDSCMPLRHMFALANYPDPASAITGAQSKSNGLRNLLARVSSVATKHMHTVWKDYKGVRIELAQNGDRIDAHIHDAFNVYNMSRRSDGFKRFVTFLLLISAKAKTKQLTNTLYLHDEPDVSLHPSGARYLRDELLRIAETNFVVYSTHSIFMIDRDRVDRHLIVEKKQEITTLSDVDSSNVVEEEVIYNALGYSVFESLKQDNIVFEGWKDKKLFEVAMSRVPDTHKELKAWGRDVGRCHVRGVKDVGRVTPMLELANRRCLILSDADAPAVEHQKAYEGYGAWKRYDEFLPNAGIITSEDFIAPSAWATPIARTAAKIAGATPLPKEELAIPGGRLLRVQRWVVESGVKRDDVKDYMREIKDTLFDGLKASHIEGKYYEMLGALQQEMEMAKVGPKE